MFSEAKPQIATSHGFLDTNLSIQYSLASFQSDMTFITNLLEKILEKTMWKTSITNFYHILGEDSNKKQDLGINLQLMVFRCAPENSKALWSQWLALLRLFGLGELVSWLSHPPTVRWLCERGEIGVALLEKGVLCFGMVGRYREVCGQNHRNTCDVFLYFRAVPILFRAFARSSHVLW